MALINCVECTKEVSDTAKTCPHCGFQLIEDKVQEPIPEKIKPKPKLGCFNISIIAIFFLGLFYLISTSGDNPSSDNSSSTNKFLAYNYAENFVKEKIKSPSTAVFPGIIEKDKHITDLDGGKYQITSWVDSQNGFGATIRTSFSCMIIFEGDQVSCENLILK